MSKPQIPICNGGPETFGRTDGTFEWAGHINIYANDTVKTKWNHPKNVSQRTQAEEKLRAILMKALQKQLGALSATAVCNTREIVEISHHSHEYYNTSIHLTCDAFRFVPNGESA
jgi:hypothetical protein